MASKGQKFNNYSPELKSKIIAEKRKGLSYSQLSRKYNVSVGTLMTWYHKYNRPDYNIFTRIYSTCRRMDIILQHNKNKRQEKTKEKNLHKKRKVEFLLFSF